jgi:DMSO/TMAO reductase YedYZ molybdopterin-dependent catalytic subunit
VSRDLFRLGDLRLGRASDSAGLPPGQAEISTYPRFATNYLSDPVTTGSPTIEISGGGVGTVRLDAAVLSRLPRREVVADFHCVAGWTARDLGWEGVLVRDLYELLSPHPQVTHLRVCGRDGFRGVLALDDALRDDVLIADRLDGEPLPVEHGGPWRIVSPSQYGYKSVKHLDRIELHFREPSDRHAGFLPGLGLQVLAPHPRARVWQEERHRHVPAPSVRWVYRSLGHPVVYTLSYLGALRTRRR